jgi:hypothetical protein
VANEPGIADAARRSVEPPPDCQQPDAPDHDWLGGLATDDDDDDERRRLVRELVMRALV